VNRHIGAGDFKNVIVFDPYLQVTWFGACADIVFAFDTGPYTILADNSIYLDRRAVGVA